MYTVYKHGTIWILEIKASVLDIFAYDTDINVLKGQVYIAKLLRMKAHAYLDKMERISLWIDNPRRINDVKTTRTYYMKLTKYVWTKIVGSVLYNSRYSHKEGYKFN